MGLSQQQQQFAQLPNAPLSQYPQLSQQLMIPSMQPLTAPGPIQQMEPGSAQMMQQQPSLQQTVTSFSTQPQQLPQQQTQQQYQTPLAQQPLLQQYQQLAGQQGNQSNNPTFIAALQASDARANGQATALSASVTAETQPQPPPYVPWPGGNANAQAPLNSFNAANSGGSGGFNQGQVLPQFQEHELTDINQQFQQQQQQQQQQPPSLSQPEPEHLQQQQQQMSNHPPPMEPAGDNVSAVYAYLCRQILTNGIITVCIYCFVHYCVSDTVCIFDLSFFLLICP
jgi:hypothetical protein